MKKIFTTIALSLLTLPFLVGQTTVTINATDNWIAFMTVTNLDGGFEFGSPWGIPDVQTVIDTMGNTLTLQPNFNTYRDNPNDEFWVNQTTGEGNKNMEASTFVEPGINDVDFTFTGTVQSYTLDDGYTAQYFIKALDSLDGFRDVLEGNFIFDLPASGEFSATVTADQIPSGLLLQYGFTITGRNANPDDEATLGSVVVGEAATSVNDLNDPSIEASVYPNPVANVLSIRSATPVEAFQVLNLAGQQVISGVGTQDVDVSELPAGTYSIIVTVEEGKKAMTFVKQ